MFLGVVALIDDEETDRCLRGNGKTNTLTYLLYKYKLKGYRVWTNYYTSFSDEVIGFQEMINRLVEIYKKNEALKKEGKPIISYKIVLGVTELQEIINSVGSSNEQVLFVDSFTSQIRKLDVDCLYDTQVLKHLHIRVRRHTERILIPIKYHLDGRECNYDRCKKEHLIFVHSYKPFRKYPVKVIKAWKVGKLYDSFQRVEDKIIIEKPIKEKR